MCSSSSSVLKVTQQWRWPTLTELRRRTSVKWRFYEPDVLPLWVAEMDVMLAEPVAKALTDAIALGDTGYPAGTGYAEAFDDFARKRWGWDGIALERSMVVPDVMLGIVEVLKIVTRPGDGVVVNNPVYPPFFAFTEHMSRRIIEAPLGADHRLDLDALEAAFQQATAYLLCSPHNPTGTVHTADELAAVAALANEYRVQVIADEIHAPLVLPGATHVPFLSLPAAAGAVSFMSASKAWNLAGAKAALAVAGPAAMDVMAQIPEEVSHGPSHLGAIAHTAALRDGGEWLDSLLRELDHNRRLLGDLLADRLPAIKSRPPQATYLAWLDCRALGLSEHTGPAAVFLERGRLALNAGQAFGTGGAGHVRLNYATSPEIIAEAVQRMENSLI
ncbi:MAG TPA: cystathionine beta-lyase [Micromonosporaceae bacterium]|nr:cystathionine beta-lyase [Micromonosporaceae bacterium]HCU51395.1 cystathionine beta-lyase [Micromonosporaceae bacterium]